MQLTMRIVGKVQGVWYRASTAGIARDLRLTGYAKNLPDESVEIVAVGPKSDLEKLRRWCELGPANAKVEAIKEDWSDTEEQFDDFAVN